MPCHHTWTQASRDEISSVNGSVVTRYTHQCPQCGKIKVTVRASRALPPELKWKRELEKLIQRAEEAGYGYRDIRSTPALLIESGVYALPIKKPSSDQ